MTKLEIYENLMEMRFYDDAVKRETTSNRVKWVMGLLDCDYQSAYRAVKAVRNGENMDYYINNHYTQSFRKQLKGIRSWWNRNAKSKYKTPLTEKEFIDEVFCEYVDTGSVEMRSMYAKDGCTKSWH